MNLKWAPYVLIAVIGLWCLGVLIFAGYTFWGWGGHSPGGPQPGSTQRDACILQLPSGRRWTSWRPSSHKVQGDHQLGSVGHEAPRRAHGLDRQVHSPGRCLFLRSYIAWGHYQVFMAHPLRLGTLEVPRPDICGEAGLVWDCKFRLPGCERGSSRYRQERLQQKGNCLYNMRAALKAECMSKHILRNRL